VCIGVLHGELVVSTLHWNTLQKILEKISVAKVKAADAKMKNNTAAGLSGIISEILKALGEASPEWMANVCNAVVRPVQSGWLTCAMQLLGQSRVDGLRVQCSC